jgi:ribosomal protein S6 kinase alpha-5
MSGDSGTPAKVVTGKRGTGDSGFGTLEEDNNGPPTKQVKSNCPEQERGLTVSGTGTSLPCPDNTRVEDYQQTVRHEITEANVVDRREKVCQSDFELLQVLGTGAYGKVFLVRKIRGSNSGKLFAMKILKKAYVTRKRKTAEHTVTERDVLEAIRDSPFLATLHYAFQTDTKLHLIMDYVCGGEMFTHLHERGKFTEDEARIYIGEIVVALEKLHSLGIVYRDLKLENLLLDRDGHIVLTDFGLSKVIHPDQNNGRTFSYCGTVEYMPPEIVSSQKQGHDHTADWWSLGVLLYELVTGCSPYMKSDNDTSKEISKRIIHSSPHYHSFLSPECCTLMKLLMEKSPLKRLGAKGAHEVKNHPWFKPLSWEKLYKREYPSPFVPKLMDEMDTQNFSDEFTSQAPVDSPAEVPKNYTELFRGYSFIAPSILFGDSMFSMPPDPSKLLPKANSVFLKTYILGEEILGVGSFSTCRKCKHRLTEKEYAVKIISRRSKPSREVEMLRVCQGHPNIVLIHDVLQDEAHVYIVMELLKGGELLECIRKQHFFSESEARRIMLQLASAVEHMHKRRVVHRDLKPENLIFSTNSKDKIIKIVDFGFARELPDVPNLTTPCFTVQYAAPEILRHATGRNGTKSGYDESCDLWSLGVIMYTMLIGRAPFQPTQSSTPSNTGAIMDAIMAGKISFDQPEWAGVSQQAQNCVKGLLTVDPSQRLTLNQLLAHPWMSTEPTLPSTPLATPTALSSGDSTETAVNAAFKAFYLIFAQKKNGFSLHDVSTAPLAIRRKESKSPVKSPVNIQSPMAVESDGLAELKQRPSKLSLKGQ